MEIYDQSYHLRGTDPEYIADLVEYVDSRMRLISQLAATVESLKVAVLAALNIADELHVLERAALQVVAWLLAFGRISTSHVQETADEKVSPASTYSWEFLDVRCPARQSTLVKTWFSKPRAK